MDNYENNRNREQTAAYNASRAEQTADAARSNLKNTQAYNQANEQVQNRAEEYTTKAEAADISAQNDVRDAAYGKDWSGRAGAKWDEAKANVKAKGQEAMNNVRDNVNGQDTSMNTYGNTMNNSNTVNQDEDFGDKVKDFTNEAGEKLHEGVDKVKGWFGKDDDHPRVQ